MTGEITLRDPTGRVADLATGQPATLLEPIVPGAMVRVLLRNGVEATVPDTWVVNEEGKR